MVLLQSSSIVRPLRGGSRYEYEMNVLLTCAFPPLSTEDYSADVS
jgi:hypothetical protein